MTDLAGSVAAVYVAGGGSVACVSVEEKVIVPVYPVARFANASDTLTRTATWAPAFPMTPRPQLAPAAGVTVKAADPESGPAASVAVTLHGPAVLRVTANACWPASACTNVYDGGSTACGSVEVNATVPR